MKMVLFPSSSPSSSSMRRRTTTTPHNFLLYLTYYFVAAAIFIFILPSSDGFSRSISRRIRRTCPTQSFRELGHGRQKNNRLYSIFYDDFEDFYQHNEETGDAAVVDANKYTTNNNSNEDTDLFASLKARQEAIHTEKQQMCIQENEMKEEDRLEKQRLQHNWREANCVSTVRLTLDDWVRRLSIDLYPLIVCGSSRGNLYLADLEDGDVIDCIENVHSSVPAGILSNGQVPKDLSKCLKALYDGHDGNGPLAIAVKKDLIVSSGREGGIHACTIVGEEADVLTEGLGATTKRTKLKLQREGKFRGLEEKDAPAPLITSLAFDDRGTLWAGGYDGILRGYHHEEYDLEDRPLMLRQKHPDHVIDVGSPIVDMSIQDETGVIVVTTETAGVFLYSLDGNANNNKPNTQVLLHVNPFSGRSYVTRNGDGAVLSSGQKQFCRTATIVRNDNTTSVGATNTNSIINEITDDDIGKKTQALIVGGSFGHIYQYTIRIYGDTTGTTTAIDVDEFPSATLVTACSLQKIRPKHMGPIVSLASPSPGIMVTASHDGTMRVWDCSDDDSVAVEKVDAEEDTVQGLKEKRRPNVLYALSGYKVWLGSVFANEQKLVSDGADNTIIVHSFNEDEEAILRSQQEDEEDDKLDEDPFGALS